MAEFDFDEESGRMVRLVPQELSDDELDSLGPELQKEAEDADREAGLFKSKLDGATKRAEDAERKADAAAAEEETARGEWEAAESRRIKSGARLASWQEAERRAAAMAANDSALDDGDDADGQSEEEAGNVHIKVAAGLHADEEDDDDDEDDEEEE